MTREPLAPDHFSNYQGRDHEVVDYQVTVLPGTGLRFRGPLDPAALTAPGVVCLGAAQTFGCFTERPFPALLGSALDLPVLNLGYGGAGPQFFLRHPELVALANRASVVVLQVMSGRSENNSLFASGGLEYLVRRSDGARLSAQDAWRDVLVGRRSPSLAGRVSRRALTPVRRRRTARLVAETRRNWLQSYRDLLDALEVPTVLLWFSRRAPDYVEDYGSVARLFGAYPQLVRGDMVARLVPEADAFADCTTSRGLPQPLVSRFTGKPTTVDPREDRADLGGPVWTHNDYYPSPEMHEDAAAALLPVCRALLDGNAASPDA